MGYGFSAKVFVSFLIAMFPIILNTTSGLRMVEEEKLQLVRAMGASPFQLFFNVSLPAALPNIFTGLKISITLALVGAFAGEYISATEGMASILLVAWANHHGPLLFAAALVLVVVGYILFLIMTWVERLTIPWHVSQRSIAGIDVTQ